MLVVGADLSQQGENQGVYIQASDFQIPATIWATSEIMLPKVLSTRWKAGIEKKHQFQAQVQFIEMITILVIRVF